MIWGYISLSICALIVLLLLMLLNRKKLRKDEEKIYREEADSREMTVPTRIPDIDRIDRIITLVTEKKKKHTADGLHSNIKQILRHTDGEFITFHDTVDLLIKPDMPFADACVHIMAHANQITHRLQTAQARRL